MRTYQPHAAWQKKTKLDTKGTKKKKEDQKYTNEIGICIPLLETIEDLKDKVITADALLTQHKIANYIRDRGGHYMLTLKDNQKTLNEEVTVFFQELFRLKPDAEPDFESRTGDETDSNKKASKIQHGRSELRQIWVSEKLNEYLNDEFKFPGIAQVFRVRREVDHYKEGEVKKKTVEISVGITSLSAHQADAKTLLQYNRGHWSIEVIHRILDHDNNWNEDKCRIRKGFGPENMTSLRRLAIAIIRRHGKGVAPTLRKLRANARMLLDYLVLTGNTRRLAAVLQ